jgi:hypothetical protein
MQLFPNEQRLVASDQDKVLLTNYRISRTDKEWGRSYQITIFLENISSVEKIYQSNPLLVVVAVVCFLLGLMILAQGRDSNGNLGFGSFALALIFFIFWLISKRQVVTITSAGGSKLNFRVDGMNAAQVEGFIDDVQAAQAARIKELHKL